MTPSLTKLQASITTAWRNHHEAKRGGAVSLSNAYEAQAQKLTAERNHATAARAGLVTEARRERLESNALSFDAQDPQIRMWAKRCAGEGGALIDCEGDAMDAKAAAINLCRRYGVEPPPFKDKDTEAQTIAKCRRCACSKWWRRRGRVLVARRVELAAIKAGTVTKAREVYASEPGVLRKRERGTSNAELLDSLTATNEQGDAYSLSELAELSTANPELRRNELMTRIHGLEEISEARGDKGLFVTLTVPSRFHAVIAATNRPNPLYDGSTPREAQAWFNDAWALIRAKLHKLKIRLYGLRCVEPHHDGTPHWHLLLFAASREHQAIRRTIFAVCLDELPADPVQAAERKRHGVKVKTIRKEKGSATGYIAKYLAKNIDGHQLTMTWERGADGSLHLTSREPATAAERIRAWASIWGIRQFQFLGTPPVTWWRELRRVREPQADKVIEAARKPADAGDYALHVMAVGGVCRPRDDLALKTLREPIADAELGIGFNVYGEPMAAAIRGVESFMGEVCISRVHTWTVKQGEVRPLTPAAAAAIDAKAEAAFMRATAIVAPWTRVNNCNQADQVSGESLEAAPPVSGVWPGHEPGIEPDHYPQWADL